MSGALNKRSQSFHNENCVTSSASISLDSQQLLPFSQTLSYCKPDSNVDNRASIFTNQRRDTRTAEEEHTLTILELTSPKTSKNSKEKRPKTPKLTKEEKRAASSSYRLTNKKFRGDMATSELLKASNLLPNKDLSHSSTIFSVPQLDLQLTPVGFEPSHMLSRPLRAYTRRYQPTFPQPLIAPSVAIQSALPTVHHQSPNIASSTADISTTSSPLIFSYQSSDLNVTISSNICISAVRYHPPPRRKGISFRNDSTSVARSGNNSHEPEVTLHRNLFGQQDTQIKAYSSNILPKHSYSTKISPMGQVPQPLRNTEEFIPNFKDNDIHKNIEQQGPEPSLVEPEEGGFINSCISANSITAFSIQQDHSLQSNTNQLKQSLPSMRKPRPMSTTNNIPIPQPSVFAGVDSVLETHSSITLSTCSNNDAFSQQAASIDQQSHTPDAYCSQGTASRFFPHSQLKSQSFGVSQQHSYQLGESPHNMTTVPLEQDHLDQVPSMASPNELLNGHLPTDNSFNIEAAITDIITVESARFGQLASTRVRELLLDRVRYISKATSPRASYLAIREQFDKLEFNLLKSLSVTSEQNNIDKSSRTTSPAIFCETAYSEFKIVKQKKHMVKHKSSMNIDTQISPSSASHSNKHPDINELSIHQLNFSNPSVSTSNSLCLDLLKQTEIEDNTIISLNTSLTNSKVTLNCRNSEIEDTSPKGRPGSLLDLSLKAQTVLLSEPILQNDSEQVLRSMSPEDSLPSISPDTPNIASDGSLRDSSLFQSIVEPSTRYKLITNTLRSGLAQDFTPMGTQISKKLLNTAVESDSILGRIADSSRLRFAQHIIYDAAACRFDYKTQTITPQPVIAMDYSVVNQILVTASADGSIRVYALQALQTEQSKSPLCSESQQLTACTISSPVSTYTSQHAEHFPNAQITSIRLNGTFLVVGYDDGYVLILDLLTMSEVSYWFVQSKSAIVDFCFTTITEVITEKSLDAIFLSGIDKQTDSFTQPDFNIFICTKQSLSIYTFSEGKERQIDMNSYMQDDEDIQFTAIAQNRNNLQEIYVGCVGGTIFKFVNFVPQKRFSLTQTDKITSLSVSGEILAIGCHNGMTVLFSVKELHSYYRLKSYQNSAVSKIYCDDGKLVVANASGVFTMWDRRSHLRCVHSSRVHSAPIVGLIVAEGRLLTSSYDGYTNCFEFYHRNSTPCTNTGYEEIQV